MQRKKLPLNIADFPTMIEQGYLYIDKTAYIRRLVDMGQFYFLSRPRRFGKTLLLSTLAALFEGRRELFRGLYIENHWDWQPHPVIRLSFLGMTNTTTEAMSQEINSRLSYIADSYGLTISGETSASLFYELIKELSSRGRVVILIDEYDKPLLDRLGDEETVEKNRRFLGTFFAVIKSLEDKIAFAFLTGVSKFTQVSIFSELNNLKDISLSEAFAGIVGYTEAEVSEHLTPYLPEELGGLRGDELKAAVRAWYNGYSWDGKTRIYNPVSMLNFLQEKSLRYFWFSTGTPRFLIELLRRRHIPLDLLEDATLDIYEMEGFEPNKINSLTLMFQTGYLTIKKIENPEVNPIFHLGYPNHEVREAFLRYFLNDCTELPSTHSLLRTMRENIQKGDLNSFNQGLQRLFRSIPYNIFVADKEAYYHTVIYLALSLLGMDIRAEIQTNVGRIDAVIETSEHLYVMEFKLGTAAEAMAQIHAKGYADPYRDKGKILTLVGVGIDTEERNISTWIDETLS